MKSVSATIVTMTPGMTPTYVPRSNSRRWVAALRYYARINFVMALRRSFVLSALYSALEYFLGNLCPNLSQRSLLVMALLLAPGEEPGGRLGLSNPQRLAA